VMPVADTERDAQWEAACKPTFRTDKLGVTHSTRARDANLDALTDQSDKVPNVPRANDQCCTRDEGPCQLGDVHTCDLARRAISPLRINSVCAGEFPAWAIRVSHVVRLRRGQARGT
jgi:hypothetical protein